MKERISKEQFLQALAQGRKDFSNTIFEMDMDLRQDIPCGKNTARGLLEGLDFSYAKLDFVNFAYLEFRNCIFDHASLIKTNFDNVIFDHCSLNTNLHFACLKYIKFKTD